MYETTISPQRIFSSVYVLKDFKNVEIARIGIPTLLRLLKSNHGFAIEQGKEYTLVDSYVNFTGASSLSREDRSCNTYIKDGDSKIVELIYAKRGTNEAFAIHNKKDNQILEVRLTSFDIFTIYQSNIEVGTLFNRGIIFRKSKLTSSIEIPALSQALIFWGSKNTLN
jgi:hypothetical protein